MHAARPLLVAALAVAFVGAGSAALAQHRNSGSSSSRSYSSPSSTPSRSYSTPTPSSPRPSFNDAARGSSGSSQSSAFKSSPQSSRSAQSSQSAAFKSGGSTGAGANSAFKAQPGSATAAFKAHAGGVAPAPGVPTQAAGKGPPNLRDDFRKAGTGNWGGNKSATKTAAAGGGGHFPGCSPGDAKCQFNCSSGAWSGERCHGPKFPKPEPHLKPQAGTLGGPSL